MDSERVVEVVEGLAGKAEQYGVVINSLSDKFSDMMDNVASFLEDVADELRESADEGTESGGSDSEDFKSMYNYLVGYSPTLYGTEEVENFFREYPEELRRNYEVAKRLSEEPIINPDFFN